MPVKHPRGAATRFDRDSARRYWKDHDRVSTKLDFGRDPDGLGVACHVGEPLWLNQHYARFQGRAFDALLTRVGSPISGARALDVGCGAGRWCRLLNASGYKTTGIDLQERLIELNRDRYPDIDFEAVSILDFEAPRSFELVSSVTVLQHLPFADQAQAISRIREALVPGGHALVLENVHDQGPHVFSNSVPGWEQLFSRAGFTLLTARNYDYSPMMRMHILVSRTIGGAARPNRVIAQPDVETLRTTADQPRSLRKRFSDVGKQVAAVMDSAVERPLFRLGAAIPSVHAAMLFRVT